MKKIKYAAICLVMAFFVLTSAGVWAQALEGGEESAARILVLFSYSPDFPTTDSFMAGLEAGFEGEDVILHREFMDTKRIYNETHIRNFYSLLAHKLETRPPYDLVIVADDNALRFMADYHQMLFGPIPILFMGINSEDLAYATQACDQITGIVEKASMKAQLALIQDLFPRMDELVVLRDQTATGLAEYEDFHTALEDFPDMRVRELDSTNYSFAEFEEELNTVHGNDVIFLLSSYMDREGARRDFQEVMALMRDQAAPVFTPYEFGLGQGAMGGKLVNYTAYGENLARTALAVLGGDSIQNFPILDGETTNRYLFDFRELERFFIDKAQLPEGSQIRYQPQPFYQVYKEVFIAIMLLGIFAMIAIVFLTVLLGIRSKSEQALREKSLRFLSFFEAVDFPVVILDEADRIVQSNRPFLKFFHLNAIKGQAELHQVIGDWKEVRPDEYELVTRPYIHAKVNFIVDGDQKLGSYVLFSDQSKERMLERNLSVYKNILEANQEAVFIADHEKCFVWANQAFLDLVQRKLSRLSGVSVRLALDPLSGSQAIWPALESQGYWTGELDLVGEEENRTFLLKIFAVLEGREVLNYIGMMEEITAAKQQERMLIEMTRTDRLTGLMNRTQFFDRAQARLQKSETARLVMLNLNHMKVVNDRFGHYIGDEVVRQVANRLRLTFSEAMISRLGGDEFAMSFYDVCDEDWNSILMQLKQIFGRPFHVGEEDLEVTASIGTARYPRDAGGIPELVTCADLAMSSWKRDQKNYIVAYREEMKAKAHDSYELMASMKHGIEAGEFFLEYQPIVEGGRQRIVAVEALIRWNHPKLGLVSPLRFIPIAESMGYIHPIGRWVLDQAVADLARLPDDLMMHVNVSVSQLDRLNFFSEVRDILGKYQIAPERLVLEFTETLPFSDGTQIEDFLKDARQAGVQIAIDDFGQGYANLAQLRQLPADILKVDQFFIHEIDQNQENKKILQSIVVLSKQFGCSLVAEGVEEETEAKVLSEMKCLLQGYYFARPMGLEALTGLIQKMQQEETDDRKD